MQTLTTDDLDLAASLLREGNLVAFPTETVYGLGAAINHPKAVAALFEIKGRPSDNPLIVHIASQTWLPRLAAHIPEGAQALIDAFWPGPLTLVLQKHADIDDAITAGLQTIAIRFPALPLAQALLLRVDTPVAAPSANLSGKPSSTQYEHALKDFEGKIAAVLKGSLSEYGLESTVVDCTTQPFSMLRPGSVSLEALNEIVPTQLVDNVPTAPKSPGQKHAHYQPKAQVCLVDDVSGLPQDPDAAFIGLHLPPHLFKATELLASESLYAQRLFAFFRECDEANIPRIFAETVPRQGIGLALMNRLDKAATPKGSS